MRRPRAVPPAPALQRSSARVDGSVCGGSATPLRADARPVSTPRAFGPLRAVDAVRSWARGAATATGAPGELRSRRALSGEWCEPDCFGRLRRSLAGSLRKEGRPSDIARSHGVARGVKGLGRLARGSAGVDRRRDILVVPLQGLASPRVWERTAAARVGTYSHAWMDALCAGCELVVVGLGLASGRGSAGWLLTLSRGRALWAGPPRLSAKLPPSRAALHVAASRSLSAARVLDDLLGDLPEGRAGGFRRPLWILGWPGGDHEGVPRAARPRRPWPGRARARRRFARRRRPASPQIQGPGRSHAPLFRGSPRVIGPRLRALATAA